MNNQLGMNITAFQCKQKEPITITHNTNQKIRHFNDVGTVKSSVRLRRSA